ncbi:MAG: bifunctional heptose 7-phosphate kinase/heptose 1-phosphate adenyltransferase [Phycisphaerales bacterium]|nr:MAG: bifunctional heptose 7-phosphate kinase/heptose 1-phosphate adenyltransferase [Phycisphaerales bacterium]
MLLHRLSSYRPFTVLVIGDFMLDQHVLGAAERLSPDAPVPVLQATKFENRAGGAANVALCLQALKADVHCFGVTGRDAEGDILREELTKVGCATTGLLVDPGRPTTIKRSLIGLAQHRHPQKMFRVDLESRDPLDEEMQTQLLNAIHAAIEHADVVCLEDYNKGVCCEELCRKVIALCREVGKPLLVDPAAIEDYTKYRGATAITPNRSEAELATGLDTPLEASQVHNAGLATKLLTELDLDAVVLTLDRHGALLETRNGDPILVPTVARSVYDVSGAGDMVLAALAGGVANGFTWQESVEFANAAAGLEVEVFGVQPIPFAAVRREVLSRSAGLHGKVRDRESLLIELDAHREAGRSVVLTNGCFDVIHAGHVAYLREARQQGDVLVVGVNADDQVREQKGPGRPIYPEKERLEILSELQCVDYLIVFPEPTAHELLRALQPDVYVKGGDYRPEEINEHDLVQELGIELRLLGHRPGLGSTEVIEKLNRSGSAAD